MYCQKNLVQCFSYSIPLRYVINAVKDNKGADLGTQGQVDAVLEPGKVGGTGYPQVDTGQ